MTTRIWVRLQGSLWVLLVSAAVFGQSPQTAPLNPEFVKYLTVAKSGGTLVATDGKHDYGWRPSPVDLSHLQGQQKRGALAGLLTFTASYDLRTLGRVTSVKDQGPYGTCWAHATFGSLESCLLPSENRDFSENNLANLAGFDYGFNDGGNGTMSMAYLARWSGPINESDDPYPNPGGSPGGLTVQKHVQQVRLIPAKTSATGNDEIKQVLMDSGALYVSYYHDDASYNSTYKSYLYTGINSDNHAVTIVGWDDNFDKSKFNSVPAGNGAYIVKNSWGTSWGESGYYYVSYYDTKFAYGEIYAFLNAESTSNYARIYSYDPLGWVSDLGTGSSTVLWGANIFTAAAGESLCAVSFYANSINTSYEIYIYTGVTAGTPRSGTLAATQTGTCSYPGYRTISLGTPAALTAGQRFSIVLKLTTPGYNYPQPYEFAYPGYSSAATASTGQSYYSTAGSTWYDLTTFDPTANFCIKGYTIANVPQATLTVVSPKGGAYPGTVTTNNGASLTQMITNSPVAVGTTQRLECVRGVVQSNTFSLVTATNVALTLTNNATLTWSWETNYSLTVATNGFGTISLTNGWFRNYSNAVVTATVGNGWRFLWWSGDTQGGTNNPVITLTMDRPRSITAQFMTNDPPGIGLSTTLLTYAAAYGGASPTGQMLILTNFGQSALSYSNAVAYGTQASGWFSFVPMTGMLAGSAGQVLTGVVNSVLLTAGIYYATNTVVAPAATNSPQYVSVALTVAKANQTITSFTPSNGSAFAATSTVGLAAQASSGPAVTFAVASGLGSINGTNLTFTGAGSVDIRASQAGDANWNPAPNMTNTFNVSKATQTALVFNPTSPQTYNTTNALTTSGGSGTGTVSYAVQSGPGQIVGVSNLWVTATGMVVVAATKTADAFYEVCSATGTVTVLKANQTITFPPIPDQMATNTVDLSATASSGLPVAFAVGNGLASINGGTHLTFTGAGSVSIVASQLGDTNWNPAPNLTNTFNVTKAGQAALVFSPTSPQTYNTTNALTTSGGSGTGAVSYTVQSGPGQIVSGSKLWVTAIGTVMVVATRAADAMYAVQAATGQVVVVKANQAITFPAIPTQVATNTVGLSATASSGLPVAFAVGSGPAQISGGTNMTFTGSGAVGIRASQAGDANWNPAPTVTNTFAVTKAMASVILTNLTQIYDGAAKTVASMTVPSGLTVAVTYDGNSWAPTNVGTYAVTGMINDVLYQGATNGALTISALPASTALPATFITLSNFVANWTAVATATNYLVDVATTNDFSIYLGGFGNLAAGNVISCTVTGVNLGLTYYYRVRAQNAGMTSTNSGTISVAINGAPSLGATTATNILANTAYLGGSVTATNGYPITEGGVYWGTNSGTVLAVGTKYSTNGTFGVGAFSFLVTNLPAGRTNYFLAYAANSQGSNVTSVSSFLTRPDAPTVLAASNGTVSAFWANWQATESATNYFVDVSPTNNFAEYLVAYSNRMVGTVLTFNVTGLQARTEYYYHVRAENGTGIGVDSATQTVTAAAMALSTGSLTYTGTYGGSNPAVQTVVVSNLGMRGFAFTNTITYGGASGWWASMPNTGSVAGLTAMAITGTVTLSGVNAGVYVSTNTIGSSDTTNGSQTFVATITVNKADQAIMNFTPTDGSLFATTNAVQLFAQASSGLEVTNFTVVSGPGVISGLTNLTFTNSGVVSVKADQVGDDNWNSVLTVTNTYIVTKAIASVTLTNLNQTYDGTPRVVGATTVPGGLSETITYNGIGSAPTAIGNYAVTGVVNSALYQGSANGTLTVSKATLQVALNNLNQTYDGAARIVTATTVPASLAVLITYDGSATAPVNAGSYAVIGQVNETTYAGITNDTLVVAKANQTITFPTIPDQVVTSTVQLSATASSDLPVTFAIGSGPGVITGGTLLSFTGVGTVSIVASQAGNANWNAAANVTRNVTVNAGPPPIPPTGVSASDGTYTNKVLITWNTVSDATSYEVWRNTANDSGSAGKLADVAPSLTAEERESLTLRDTENQPVLAPRAASPSYDDTSAFAGVTCYYWVKTRRASDVSEFSQSDSGYRQAGLPPPAIVEASDGTYSDKVRIVWPIVTGATSYEVWRAAVNAAGFAALLGEVSGFECNDTTAQSGTVYYYWVKSKNALETSAFSLSDSGYRSGEVNIQPKVAINGASGEVALRRGDTLSVAIFLMATSGLNADWWVVIAVPGGAWYYFDAYTGRWNPITGELTPTYQGALFDFLAPIEILNMSTTWLPAGAYVFYFGVDTAMNGVLDLPPVLVYDSTTMTLTQ